MEDSESPKVAEQLGDFRVARVVRHRDADEGDSGRLCTARVIYGVTQVLDMLVGILFPDEIQAIGCGLGVSYTFVGNNWVEANLACIPR